MQDGSQYLVGWFKANGIVQASLTLQKIQTVSILLHALDDEYTMVESHIFTL